MLSNGSCYHWCWKSNQYKTCQNGGKDTYFSIKDTKFNFQHPNYMIPSSTKNLAIKSVFLWGQVILKPRSNCHKRQAPIQNRETNRVVLKK